MKPSVSPTISNKLVSYIRWRKAYHLLSLFLTTIVNHSRIITVRRPPASSSMPLPVTNLFFFSQQHPKLSLENIPLSLVSIPQTFWWALLSNQFSLLSKYILSSCIQILQTWATPLLQEHIPQIAQPAFEAVSNIIVLGSPWSIPPTMMQR